MCNSLQYLYINYNIIFKIYILYIQTDRQTDAPKPDKVCFKNKYKYKSEFNSYFADDNIIMTAGIEDGTRARTPLLTKNSGNLFNKLQTGRMLI